MRTAAGAVVVDPTGKQPGRGAYLCRDPRCWTTALRRNALAGALKTELRLEDRTALTKFADELVAEMSGPDMEGK